VLLKGVKSGEVQIATVHDVKSSGFEGQLVEDSNIVRFSSVIWIKVGIEPLKFLD